MKKYDSFKECTVRTPERDYLEMFSSDWTFKEIEFYMLDHFSIPKESVVSLRISSVTLYKNPK